MIEPLPQPRRIVTAIDDEGRSYIAVDGPSPAEFTFPGTPFRQADMWRTATTPSPVEAADDIVNHSGVLPPPHGSVLRVIDIPPQRGSPQERAEATRAIFAALYPDADHHAGSDRSPGMHTTNTIDYAILLSGELWAVMDVDETLMKAGDILIQRGTAHAWENRSDAMARIAFVLIDGTRDGIARRA